MHCFSYFLSYYSAQSSHFRCSFFFILRLLFVEKMHFSLFSPHCLGWWCFPWPTDQLNALFLFFCIFAFEYFVMIVITRKKILFDNNSFAHRRKGGKVYTIPCRNNAVANTLVRRNNETCGSLFSLHFLFIYPFCVRIVSIWEIVKRASFASSEI